MKMRCFFLILCFIFTSAHNIEAKSINLVIEHKLLDNDLYSGTVLNSQEADRGYVSLQYELIQDKSRDGGGSFFDYKESSKRNRNQGMSVSQQVIRDKLSRYLVTEFKKKKIEVNVNSKVKVVLTVLPVIHKFSGDSIPMMVGYKIFNNEQKMFSISNLEIIGYKNIMKYLLKDLRKRNYD